MGIDDIEKALQNMERLAGSGRKTSSKRPSKSKAKGSLLGGIFRKVFAVIFVLVVPFAVLLRGSIYAYQELNWGSWGALGFGAILAILVVTLYFYLLGRWVGIRNSLLRYSLMGAGSVVGVFVIYSMLFVSAGNLKNDNIRSTYRELHPLLRSSVSIIILLDQESVITDIGRVASDYDNMGLPRLENSLHFEQSDGFVHAIDFRTKGRGSIRNKLVEWYFKIAGFRTLRHVGTADHLHISLPMRRN